MALKLNETREAYKEFCGRNTKQMPKLIAEKRVPMNVAQLMQERLDVRNSDAEIKSSYMDFYFDAGDGIAYHPDGRVKIVLDSQTLRDMNPDTPRVRGALLLTEDVYNALEGEEFKKGKIGKTGEWLSKKDVKAHPVWRILARDQGLLNDYVDYTFAEGKRFDYDEAMGVFLSSAKGDTPEMRAGRVGRLAFRSNASGRDDLDDDSGRLIGIALGVLSVSGNGGVSRIKTYTMADLQAVDKAIKGLEGTLTPEILKPFVDLRKKL
jgi:hypothetical protein